jgi:hypothetical protein
MTITREGFGFNTSCDHCSHDEDLDNADTFQEAVDEIKSQGWRITRLANGEWDHTCPDCLEGEIKDLK